MCQFELDLIQHVVFSVAGLGSDHGALWRLPGDDTAGRRGETGFRLLTRTIELLVGLSGPVAGRCPRRVTSRDRPHYRWAASRWAFAVEGDELGMSASVAGHLIPPRMLRSRRGSDDSSFRLVAPAIRGGAPAGGCEADDEAAED